MLILKLHLIVQKKFMFFPSVNVNLNSFNHVWTHSVIYLEVNTHFGVCAVVVGDVR